MKKMWRGPSNLLKEDYRIICKPITTRNPQANLILKQTHQTISNILRMFQVKNSELELKDPWKGFLSEVIFSMQSIVHTTMQATPMQLVFGHDAIMNLTSNANWQLIRQQKQAAIHKNYASENKKRIKHKYKVNDEVLVMEKDVPRYKWKTARVSQVYPGRDGRIRVVDLNSADGSFQAPVHRLIPLS